MLEHIKQRQLEIRKGITDSIGLKGDSEIEKGGEGSKGGKVVGHTASGKPIYQKMSDNTHLVGTSEHRSLPTGHHYFKTSDEKGASWELHKEKKIKEPKSTVGFASDHKKKDAPYGRTNSGRRIGGLDGA